MLLLLEGVGRPLDASYHKGQYVWFRGGDMKDYYDKRSFIKKKEGVRAYPHGTLSQCHWMALILWNKNIFGLGASVGR